MIPGAADLSVEALLGRRVVDVGAPTAGEAAELAVVAGAMVDSESVFFLDSGPPVSVLDLAGGFAATAAGREVEFVGLRAGERLHEHMCWPGEEPSPTPCRHVLRAPLHRVDPAWLERQLAALEQNVQRASATGVHALLAEMHAVAELERPREAVTH